ncbi:hypothetical protein [Paenibacillus sp. LjRoot56]|uniref:hypothetical protein n=1 Tax=Paenibacillus sp. LjRoot56 TaxID=3342333 RepID=UPI003ECFC57C
MPFSNNNSSGGTSTKSKGGQGFSHYGGTSSSSSKSTSSSTKKKEELPVDPFDTGKVQKSIDNAALRIKDAGGEVDPDKRNWFEKLTNLPQGQNGLFDTFEIIGRPGSALNAWFKGKLDNKPGAEIEKDTIEAFKGKTPRVTGSDLAKEYAGIDNKYGAAAAGFAWDVASDPTNLIPVGAVAKGISKGVGLGSKVLDKVTDVIPGVNTLKNEALKPAANALKEGLGNIFKYQHGWNRTLSGGEDDALKTLYNQTENDIKYMSENSLRDITQAAKESGGVKIGTDVGRVREKDLKQFEDVKGYEFPDGVTRTENKQDLLDAIQKNRELLEGTGKNIGKESREYAKAITQTSEELQKIDGKIRRQYFSKENEALRALTKRKNKPVNIDELAKTKALSRVSVSPAFNYLLQRRDELKNGLDTLRTEANTFKTQGNQQLKSIADESEKLKESAKNPVMIQKEFQRPVRDIPTDPKVTQAAATLSKSDNELREWAVSNNIPLGELEGYMPHVLSAEEKAFRKTKTGQQVDRARSGMNNPDKGVLKSRELLGSVEDVNERTGRKFFEDNAFVATAIKQKQTIDYANAVKFRKDVLSNKNFAKPFKEGDKIPDGAVKINLNNYTFLKPGEDAVETIGGDYVVTKGVKAALDRYQHLTTDEGINAFLKAYDTGMSWWKRGALFSVGYHLRNDIGAKFNNYLAGMDPVDIAKYSTLAMNDVKNALTKNVETKLYDQFRRHGLSSTSQSAMEFAKHGDEPEKAITNAVKDMSKTNGKKALGLLNPLKGFDNSQKLGNYVDQSNRFALFRWAIEKKGMTPEKAADLVRETQFDYSRITKTEKEVFTRLAPFYRWSRNNIPFQLRKFAEDPARYSRVDKLRTNLQDSMGLEEQDTPEYMKQNLFMPVTSNGDGTGNMLGANLPVGDLTKLSNPGKLGLDSLTTALKLPIELVSNRNLFFNNDLKRFDGQEKKYQIPDDVYGASIPGGGTELGGLPVKLAYALEQLGGQPARALSKTFGKPTQQDAENSSLKPSLGISSLVKKYDIKETNLRAKQAELRKLMEYMDYLEQEQGERARSVNDIKKGK